MRRIIAGMIMLAACCTGARGAVNWVHPAGGITDETILEVRHKIATQEWASNVYKARRAELLRWLEATPEKLREIFPTRRGSTQALFSAPEDRQRLVFDPFNPYLFRSNTTGKEYDPETRADYYAEGHFYNGVMYQGWAYFFYGEAGRVAKDLAMIGRMHGDDRATSRAVEIMLLFADTIRGLPTERYGDTGKVTILSYHREGDNKILFDLAQAYELARDKMSAETREIIERDVLTRLLDDVMLEYPDKERPELPAYTTDWNNVYQWLRTVIQTAAALEREELIDWAFGYGIGAPETNPNHRSVRRILDTHFKDDGAFWELCSGYHLYPMNHFCDIAVVSRNLSAMDPQRFPPAQYDLTDPANPAGETISAALEWFIAMAMPDRRSSAVGDGGQLYVSLQGYDSTAEVGYRYYGIEEVGDYESLREGKRSWTGFLWGADQIVKHETESESNYLTSGWVSLRQPREDGTTWAGINALLPGGGHQHADRLNLLIYQQGEMLTVDKALTYAEQVIRRLGTLSPMHNTVTVDAESQPQGEALKGDQIPKVTVFHAGPFVQFARAEGDDIYSQTEQYRRSVVIVEDVIIDYFEVAGGKQHDWMVHHLPGDVELSLPVEAGSFEPREWLAEGTDKTFSGATDDDWSARWKTGEVASRLTMLGSPGTTVYQLETYPPDSPRITPRNPPTPTLCVRRGGIQGKSIDSGFLAVWDAWRTEPRVKEITAGEGAASVMIRTDEGKWYLLFGEGEAQFADGTRLAGDGALSLLRGRDGFAIAGGKRLRAELDGKSLEITATEPVNYSAGLENGKWVKKVAGVIDHTTYDGKNIPAGERPELPKVAGDLMNNEGLAPQ